MNQEKVWDEIANQWHNFRQQKFKPVHDFLLEFNINKGKILEIGCGNCRNLIPFAKQGLECYGIDFSKNMLEKAQDLAKKNNCKFILKKAEMTKLPYKSSTFDYILHIASLHHLKSEKDIINSLKESERVLKNKGLILLTVWNKLQLRFLLKPKDLLIPWKNQNKTYNRYYHLFDFLELKKLIKKTNLKILEFNLFGRNLIFVLKKETK